MSNSDSLPPSLSFPAACPPPSHPPRDIYEDSNYESERDAEYARVVRNARLASINCYTSNHRANKQLGLTNSETPLSIVPETFFEDSLSEKNWEAWSGEGNREGEPEEVNAIEVEEEQSEEVKDMKAKKALEDWRQGQPEFVLVMFRLMMPKFFPSQ